MARSVPLIDAIDKTVGWIETADSSPVWPHRNNVSPSGRVARTQQVTSITHLAHQLQG